MNSILHGSKKKNQNHQEWLPLENLASPDVVPNQPSDSSKSSLPAVNATEEMLALKQFSSTIKKQSKINKAEANQPDSPVICSDEESQLSKSVQPNMSKNW